MSLRASIKRRALLRVAALALLLLATLAIALSPSTRAHAQSAAAEPLAEAERLHSQVEQLYQNGRYDEAIPLAEQVVALREKALGPEHPDVAESLNDLAVLFQAKGDYAAAEPLHRRALAIFEKALGPEQPSLARSLNNLAELLRQKGDYAGAEPLYRRALAIVEKALRPEHPDVATSLGNLALLLKAKGDYAAAEPLYRRALAIFEKALGPEHPLVALGLNNLALLFEAKGDYAPAEPLLRRALAIFEKALGPEHPDVATSLNNLASLLEASGRATEALALRERAAGIEERLVGSLLAAGTARANRALMSQFSGQADARISAHAEQLPGNERAARLALLTALRRKGRVLDASRNMLEALRRLGAADDELQALRSARSELSTRLLGGPRRGESGAQHQAAIGRLSEQAEAIESALAKRYAGLRVARAAISLEAVQAAIPAGAALVELVSYEPFDPRAAKDKFGAPHYAAYLLWRDGTLRHARLGPAAPIDALAGTLRRALDGQSVGESSAELSRKLDAAVMEPLRGLLGDTRDVLLSPDGALNLVPFAALRDEQGRYLIERYRFTYLTSGRDLLRWAERAPPRAGPVLVAGVDFGSGPGARIAGVSKPIRFEPFSGGPELEALAPLLAGVEVLSGAAADEARLGALAGPRVLHLSTHGFFLPPAPDSSADDSSAEQLLARSGLALAGANAGAPKASPAGAEAVGRDTAGAEAVGRDNILTALEIANADLQGTQLIVLSACETAVGESRPGEGIYGLRRALVLSGAETQVLSLWRVPSQETAQLMADFYRRVNRGQGRSEALRQAQLTLLAEAPTAHPYYWAAFLVQGDARSLSGEQPPPPIETQRVRPSARGCACQLPTAADSRPHPWQAALLLLLLVAARRATSPRRSR